GDLGFARPFVGRFFAYLHESALSGSAVLFWIKPALTPNDRLHEHRIEMMRYRDRANQLIIPLKTRRAHPFVKCVDWVARSDGQINRAHRQREQYANDEFKQESNHSGCARASNCARARLAKYRCVHLREKPRL